MKTPTEAQTSEYYYFLKRGANIIAEGTVPENKILNYELLTADKYEIKGENKNKRWIPEIIYRKNN